MNATNIPNDFTLLDLRRQMSSFAYPSFWSRCGWWLMSWFTGFNLLEIAKEIRPEVDRLVGIIDAMTPKELAEPWSIDRERMLRIAHGSGTRVEEVQYVLNLRQWMQQANIEVRGTIGPI